MGILDKIGNMTFASPNSDSNEAKVSATCEMVIDVINGEVDRFKYEK